MSSKYFDSLKDKNSEFFIKKIFQSSYGRMDGGKLILEWFEISSKDNPNSIKEFILFQGYIFTIGGINIDKNKKYIFNLTNGDFARVNWESGLQFSPVVNNPKIIKPIMLNKILVNIFGPKRFILDYEKDKTTNIQLKYLHNVCDEWFSMGNHYAVDLIEKIEQQIVNKLINENEIFKLKSNSEIFNYFNSVMHDFKKNAVYDIREIECYEQLNTGPFGFEDYKTKNFYQWCYFEIESKDDIKGFEGYILNTLIGVPRKQEIFILNICNGDFLKIRESGSNLITEFSYLTGSVSDIGIPAKAGLMSDFMSYVLGDKRCENPKEEDLLELHKLIVEWFDKTTDEIPREEEFIKKQKLEKGKTMKEEINNTKVTCEIETMKIGHFCIPNKANADMYKPDSISFNVIYKNPEEPKDIFRFWFAEVLSENIEGGIEEGSLFLAIGRKLYVFNYNEELVWIHDLLSKVEGYETIHANILATGILHELYFRIHEERFPVNEETDSILYKELALLLIACTNTEIANERLSLDELIVITRGLIGYDFKEFTNFIKG